MGCIAFFHLNKNQKKKEGLLIGKSTLKFVLQHILLCNYIERAYIQGTVQQINKYFANFYTITQWIYQPGRGQWAVNYTSTQSL